MDVVVVGGGVAGAATATRLVNAGHEVAVLERETAFVDRVRGEFMPPWGVQEVFDLGLGDVLWSVPGVNVITEVVPYDETLPVEAAEANRVSYADMLPGIPGAVGVSHPGLSEAVLSNCAKAGATVHRGVTNVTVTAGSAPSVAFDVGGRRQELACRLVIGADGRQSTVRRQVGLELQSTTPRVFLGGMLVDGTGEWPRTMFARGVEDDVDFLVVPQAGGLARLYLAWDVTQPRRFTGPDRQRNFLDAFRRRCLPLGEVIAAASPAGPLAAVPMTDTWIDEPCPDGVVLVGDAAGWSDPTIGQGLSVAFRDARILSDVLLNDDTWTSEALNEYVEERTERMRRLRFSMSVFSLGVSGLDGRVFGPEARAYRIAIRRLARKEPLYGGSRVAIFKGAWRVPDEAFSDETFAALASATQERQ